ncbi:substrate-binding periplasmic protein [Novispirillum itersonii]|uniref:Polar amino acid transport system substrate-binding protein n=1 Tax=Novispirillum itersonii TaxID=189 RepID=A0A7W9ZDE3_NOVIT|nr:transporter substrate-binding domain-containing protein [Novispirillum itersonii]MBB6209437.1 polar amino acid transport system substrate-binding protein [Novispirillum itersonii]
MSVTRRLRSALYLVVTVLGVVLFSATGRTAEVWHVLMDDRFPPYSWMDGGHPAGLDTEIVHAVLTRIGVTPEYEAMPWNRVLKRLDLGGYDLAFQFVETPERREKYLLVGPFRMGRTVVMVRRGHPLRFESMGDLTGLRVVTVQGFAYTADFDAATGFTRIPVNDVTLGVKMLAAGRADAMIGDIWSLSAAADSQGLSGQLLILPDSLSEVGRHVIIPKGKAEKAARFADGLDQIRADGTLQGIVNRWLNPALVQLPQ